MHKLTMQEMMAVSGGTCYSSVPVYDAYNNLIGWRTIVVPCSGGGGGGGGGGCWQDSYNVLHC